MQTRATREQSKSNKTAPSFIRKQPSFFAPLKIQRTPTTPASSGTGTMPPMSAGGGTTVPATEADIRLMVTEATRMLTGSVDFFQLANVDDATLERVLTSWIRMADIYPGFIAARLNNDAALLQAFQTAFNNAVRVLFTRRAAQPGANTTINTLYLSNLYRLPRWSWPDMASFNLSNEAQRRAFVANYTNALNVSSVFQGFTAITAVQLESVLSYLFTLTTDTQNMMAANLGNDATLVTGLHTAYSAAVNSLLSRAALVIPGETVFSLFMRYRYQRTGMIHEWADQQISGMTVAVPQGQSVDPLTGDVNFSLNGYNVTMSSDGSQTEDGATTHAQFAPVNIPYQFDTSTNRITSFTAPSAPAVTIWTDYGPGLNSRSSSGYGRGTTAEDVRLGNISLGYHERTHSRDFLRYMVNTQPPVFTGTTTMTVTQFKNSVKAYTRALGRMSGVSEIATDCVGSPNIVQYHSAHGTHTTVTCP